MRLTNYIKDLGRVIAYYPNLKQVTHSTTASIMLCQFLYWTDKTKDGWIYKTHYEIEEETGLTYNEQKTARAKLVELGILQEEFKRWDRTNRYRVNQKRLNDLWDEYRGKPILVEEPDVVEPVMDLTDYQNPDLHPEHPSHNTAAIKKGDLVDGIIALSQSPGVQKENAKNEIRGKLSTKLHIYIDSTKWDKFIDFVYIRETKYNEPVEKFIAWLLENNSDSRFWTPDKFMMWYPQAFVEKNKPIENFVPKPPEHKEDDSIPMPDYVKSKKKQF